MRIIAGAFGILQGAYMLFDGVHGVLTREYFEPYHRLGPWTAIVAAAGIAPLSMTMRIAFIVLGAAYILAAAGYLSTSGKSWKPLAAVAILTLWYAPVGTLLSLAILAMMRAQAARPQRKSFV